MESRCDSALRSYMITSGSLSPIIFGHCPFGKLDPYISSSFEWQVWEVRVQPSGSREARQTAMDCHIRLTVVRIGRTTGSQTLQSLSRVA